MSRTHDTRELLTSCRQRLVRLADSVEEATDVMVDQLERGLPDHLYAEDFEDGFSDVAVTLDHDFQRLITWIDDRLNDLGGGS